MYNSPRTKKKRQSHPEAWGKATLEDDPPSAGMDSQDLIPFITYSEPLFCVFCKKSTAPLIKLPSGIFINLTGYAHEICLKNKGCCECGVLGLCYRCTVKDCWRLIHPWCAQALHGNANFCDLHSNLHKKKESSRLPFIKSICRRIPSSSFWEKDYKEKDSPASFCNGNIFWYLLDLEFFPSGYDLACFPLFPICSQFELQYESNGEPNDFVKSMVNKVENDLEKVQNGNMGKIKSLMQLLETKNQQKILDFQRNEEEFVEVNDDFLNLMEKNIKPAEVIPNLFSGLRKHKIRKVLEPENLEGQDLCEVCNEDDFEEQLLVCQKCQLKVHAKCYKTALTGDFICETCKFSHAYSAVSCVLCPKKAGALKQTFHSTKDPFFQALSINPSQSKPDPNLSPKKKLPKQNFWVHAFCALHTPGVIFTPTGVDLSEIDQTRFHILCEICNSKDGACLQCSFNGCNSSFHPGCGRALFVSSKSSEKKIYCALHKPHKLRKMLETRNKKLAEDIYKFCKAMEKYFSRSKVSIRVQKRKRGNKIRNSSGKIFTPDEDLALEFRIQQFLYKLNLSQKKPFSISINLQASTRCSKVSITRPQFYTLIVPGVILEESITIENRSAEECFKRYQDSLFSKLRNEMLLLGNRLCLYQGKELPPTKNYTRHKKKTYEISQKVSNDTYCICNQPYYYEIPWMAEWTQEEWEEKIRENEMIECTKCEKWFHLKCVKYEGTLDKAQQDENWKCGNCDKKKAEKAKHLDQNSIISDLNQGVVTRRGTKIH